MRAPILAAVLVSALVAVALALPAHGVRAGAPPPGAGQTSLRATPPSDEVPGRHEVILSARLTATDGRAISGVPVTFYVLTTVFGERLMKVGDTVTDGAGMASLVYGPSWVGDHTVLVRFAGTNDYAPSQTSFQFSAAGAVPVHENARFGLAPIRAWAPLVIGAVVLAFWGVLGFVAVRIIRGIPAAAVQQQSAWRLAGSPVSEPSHRALAQRALLLVAVLGLLAVPIAWPLLRERGALGLTRQTGFVPHHDAAHLQGEPTAGPTAVTGQATPLRAPLLRTVPFTTDIGAAAATTNLPGDVAIVGQRAFVLDPTNGRLLSSSHDGQFAPVLETERAGAASLRGAEFIAVRDGTLYIANPATGRIVVVSGSETIKVEDVIEPQAPPGQQPLRIAGIAVTRRGEIWLADAANHRVLLLDGRGVFQRTIGSGIASGADDALNTPGGLTLDERGNLLVADTMNHVVKRFSPLGVFMAAIGQGHLDEPVAVTVDEQGNIFVSDPRLASVLVFAPGGAYRGSIQGMPAGGGSGAEAGLQSPFGLRADGRSLYVVDRFAGLYVFGLDALAPAP